jgi:hypothetical protein
VDADQHSLCDPALHRARVHPGVEQLHARHMATLAPSEPMGGSRQICRETSRASPRSDVRDISRVRDIFRHI